ncbi:MAG: HD domain-containing protein, partial [Candidatus Liptonbacteria bacterium]
EDVQKLILDIVEVKRNHRIPGTERRENVVEHSFSVAMLCWKIFDVVKPPLDLATILKYALIHDFSERGQGYDVNSYASETDRNSKKNRETEELKKINNEFRGFEDFTRTLIGYESHSDQEALFVWSVDKMQHIILGKIDNWRPYAICGIKYNQFCEKNEEYIERCSPHVKDIFRRAFERVRKTYYDQPTGNL